MTRNHSNVNDAATCGRELDIAPYLQGAMQADQRALFERHLGECAACRRRTDEFRQVIEKLRQVPAESPVRDLTPDIIARIPQDAWAGKHLFGRFAFSPALLRFAAAVICVAGAGALLACLFMARQKSSMAQQILSQSRRQAPVASANVKFDEKALERKRAVSAALEWLASAQEQEGNWDAAKWGAEKQYTVGITALSLLAFTGSDPHVLDSPSGTAVCHGLDYLITHQNENGRFGPECREKMYNHGIATLALLEAYALKRDSRWKNAIILALQFTCRQQGGAEAWGYDEKAGSSMNTAATVWPLQSLILADSLGFPDLKPGIKRSILWLKNMTGEDGRVAYSTPGEFPAGYEALTAAGTLCMLRSQGRIGGGDIKKMLAVIQKSAEEQGDNVDYYRWYFLTEALQIEGGQQSEELVGRLQHMLLAKQTRGGDYPGSWELSDQWSASGGRVYTTAMSVLSLQ